MCICKHPDGCDYTVENERKYGVVQKMLQHKKGFCKNQLKAKSDCEQCDFKANDRNNMKRHMRDAHEVNTVSTSPPPKKTRRAPLTNEFEITDMDIDDDGINNISLELEEMDIDRYEENEKELNKEEDLLERSRKEDAKIKEKEEENRRKEIQNKIRLIEDEQKKQLDEDERIAKDNAEVKKRKQKKKDDKKKQKKKSVNKSIDIDQQSAPNVRNIPGNCKHLVKEGDIVYVVPGDGCCGPNSAAALLFHDEKFGPQLRRRMNIFFADHWHKKYKFKSQCSPGHPFERMIGEGKVSFTDPEKLIAYLKNSCEAAYMWSDSEDLAIIADMYQLKIKVITTKGSDDENPTVNWIHPDDTLKEFAELRDFKMDDMVLLHESDSHFNLVISEDSDLAKLGSLSHRENVKSTKNVLKNLNI